MKKENNEKRNNWKLGFFILLIFILFMLLVGIIKFKNTDKYQNCIDKCYWANNNCIYNSSFNCNGIKAVEYYGGIGNCDSELYSCLIYCEP